MVYADHGVPQEGLIAYTRLFLYTGGWYGISLPCGDFFSIKPTDSSGLNWGAFKGRKQTGYLTWGIHKKEDKEDKKKYKLIPVIQGPDSLCYLVVLGNPPEASIGRRPKATAYWSQGPLPTIPQT